MDIFNLWPLDVGGQATAEEAQRRRATRWDEPAPVPAQLMAGMAHPFTHFNRPGEDPIQQGIELGLAGISPFRGRIATARPRMTPQEELWSQAQSGDIQATGQLTGEMWQRDLAEMPGPPAPDTAFPGDLYHGGMRGGPRQDFPVMNIDDFEQPRVGERSGEHFWTGDKWLKAENPNQGIAPETLDWMEQNPDHWMTKAIKGDQEQIRNPTRSPTEEDLNLNLFREPLPRDPSQPGIEPVIGPYPDQVPPEQPYWPDDKPYPWEEEAAKFREGMDYLPPEGNVPPRGEAPENPFAPEDPFTDNPFAQQPLSGPAAGEMNEFQRLVDYEHQRLVDYYREYLDETPPPRSTSERIVRDNLSDPDSPLNNLWLESGFDIDKAMNHLGMQRVPYEEWNQMLRRMNVSPNVLPRINPFRT